MENKQDILKQLSSNDMDIVRGAIEQIKQEGDISIVPELLDILLQSQDTNIITNLTALLSDVKESDFKTVLMDKLISTLPKVAEKPIYYAYAGNQLSIFQNI